MIHVLIPKKSLENARNTMGTLPGVHPIVPWYFYESHESHRQLRQDMALAAWALAFWHFVGRLVVSYALNVCNIYPHLAWIYGTCKQIFHTTFRVDPRRECFHPFPLSHLCIGCGRTVSAGRKTVIESNKVFQHTPGYPWNIPPTRITNTIMLGGDQMSRGDRCILTEMNPEELGDFGAQDLANVAWVSWI